MRNISDIIERYLKQIMEEQTDGLIEIKRSEIAEKFECVPSQINYVINTRFTNDRGYLVESKRGGGGYIRIVRIRSHSSTELIESILQSIRNGASTSTAQDIIVRLFEGELLTRKEAKLMLAAIDRATLAVDGRAADELRGRILSAMLQTLRYELAP